MGVYIPNMEKPKSCWECRLMDGEANCLVTDEGIPSKQEGIHPDCPLIDIVTCGECKHKMQALSTEKGAIGCELISGTFYEDFFCKEGERRADEPNTERD